MPAYKYTLKNGKTLWYAAFNYTDWTGEHKHTCKRGFKTQREAKEYERSFLEQVNGTTDITFGALVENYLEDVSHRLKPTTMDSKRFILRKSILPYFADIKISDIDSLKIRKWQNEMISCKTRLGKPYSESSLHHINSQFAAVMNYAVKHYGLPSNPCSVTGSIGKLKTKEMQIWTLDEFNRFIGQVRKNSFSVAFYTLFYTGLRSGELLALTPDDILPDRSISVTKNFACMANGKYIVITPKTEASIRNVAIPEFLYDMLQDYIGGIYGIQPSDRIFPFVRNTLRYHAVEGAKRAGLTPIRIHDFRHSHASLLINMGVDIVEISKRLGHESPKITLDVYSHLYPGRDREVADMLEKCHTTD